MNADWFKQREPLVAAAIVLLAIIHGTVYAFAVPPWQHYDEPTHFEYAWLIASTGELPEEGGYDWVFRSRLVRSMIEHDFYRGLPVPDPEDLTTLPPGLQFPQLDDPPLYYLLASIPLRLSGSPDLANQLLSARLVSVLLLGVTVFAAWGMMREITSKGSFYRIFVPLTIALLPTFVDGMSSVNNDVGAVAVFSLFLWGSVRLIRRGATPVNLAWVAAAALAAVFTKSTAYLAVPLAVVAFVLGILPGALRRYAWIALGAGALLLGFGLLYFREPAFWYRATSQDGSIRRPAAAAPVGDHALVMDPHAKAGGYFIRNRELDLDPVRYYGFYELYKGAEQSVVDWDNLHLLSPEPQPAKEEFEP